MRASDRFRTPTLALGVLCLQACSWISPSRGELTFHGSSPAGPIAVIQLEDEIRDLADRYAMGVAEAVQRLRREVPEAEQRGLLQFKLRNATSAYDAVTSGDALEGMLDLLTLIELQNMAWLDEGRIERYSAYPSAGFLAATLGRSRTEAWSLAERALTRPQQEKAREAIREWRRRNPDVQYMSFVRFNAGSGTASFSLLNEIRAGIGGLLNPFGSAAESVEQTRDLAARALYYGKRLPTLLEWEAEASAARVAELPEVRQAVRDASSLSRSVAAWPADGRALILVAFGGLAALLGLAFLFAELSRRRSPPAERRSAAGERPPTRLRSPD